MNIMDNKDNDLMTPSEFARALRLDPKTVSRWAAAGKIRAVKTLGGHRRFHRADLDAILAGQEPRTD